VGGGDHQKGKKKNTKLKGENWVKAQQTDTWGKNARKMPGQKKSRSKKTNQTYDWEEGPPPTHEPPDHAGSEGKNIGAKKRKNEQERLRTDEKKALGGGNGCCQEILNSTPSPSELVEKAETGKKQKRTSGRGGLFGETRPTHKTLK